MASFDREAAEIADNSGVAVDKLITRDAVFFNKTVFRVLFNLSRDEVDNMTAQEYLDYLSMQETILKLWHAPYLKHD